MPVKLLSSGAAIILDTEDFDLVETYSWHIAKHRPSLKPFAARTEVRYGRMYRTYLHRSVALRSDPSLVKQKFWVYPKNGDFLDCRRDNLEIKLARKRRGGKRVEPRPVGWERYKYVGHQPWNALPVSDLWAGGYTLRDIDRHRSGGPRRLTRCISGTPID